MAWLAMELVRFLAQDLMQTTMRLQQNVLTFSHLTGVLGTHCLVTVPDCPSCAPVSESDLTTHPPHLEVHLSAQAVQFASDGGHRTVTPEATLKKYQHLISPITGMVRHLVPISPPNSVATVFAAGHNPVMSSKKLSDLKKGLRWGSSGKGVSAVQAQVSALCEALERYSGEWPGHFKHTMTQSYEQMLAQWGTAHVIHPNAVMHYSEAQYAAREAINAKNSIFNRVPEPLPDDEPIAWRPIWSLSHQSVKYVPAQLVSFHAPARLDCDKVYAFGCSNGNASGNTLEEAILQGFCELVERDAVALWWYNRLSKPEIDLTALAQSPLGKLQIPSLLAEYRQYKRECWALDLTADLGISVVVALSRRIDQPQEDILMGLGCHLDPQIAVQRAFAEMNQMLWMATPHPETGQLMVEDEETLSWLKHATLDNQPHLSPDATRPAVRVDMQKNLSSGDLQLDIEHCLALLREHGLEMLVLNQTRTDIGLPVVKVMVPGLRHFWARFASGRLYDVPVSMGWLAQKKLESELNPIPIFF
jgi:ribosomal protein S12 methylthiotransferase accessory factor